MNRYLVTFNMPKGPGVPASSEGKYIEALGFEVGATGALAFYNASSARVFLAYAPGIWRTVAFVGDAAEPLPTAKGASPREAAERK